MPRPAAASSTRRWSTPAGATRSPAISSPPPDGEPSMPADVTSFFSQSYAEAREKFLAAAEAAGAHLVDSHPHPLKGPDGGDLATDVAWLGPRDARKLLVLNSSTHGIEGYCGS